MHIFFQGRSYTESEIRDICATVLRGTTFLFNLKILKPNFDDSIIIRIIFTWKLLFNCNFLAFTLFIL